MVLTREQIAQAALELLDEEGLDSLTVRKVASKLGVQHGALYWHVKHKQDLLDEVAEAILREEFVTFDASTTSLNWESWLIEVALRLRKSLLAHRDGAKIVATSHSKSRVITLAKLGELIITTLTHHQFDLKTATIVYYSIISYTFGLVVQEQDLTSPEVVRLDMISHESDWQFPQLIAGKQAVFNTITSNQDLFLYGLKLIIKGAK